MKSRSQTRYLLIEVSEPSGAEIHDATFCIKFSQGTWATAVKKKGLSQADLPHAMDICTLLLPHITQLNDLWLDSAWENTLFWELIPMINHPLGSKYATSFNLAAFLLPASGSCHANLYIFIYIKRRSWILSFGFFGFVFGLLRFFLSCVNLC